MIEAVMLWNEPNNLSHWDRGLDPHMERFAEMVCLAGDRLARVAPGLTRVLGGISPLDPLFVQELFSMGVGEAVDVVGVHGFPLDWNHWHVDEWPERLQAVRAVCAGKPVWVTEAGASSFVSGTLQSWALDRMAALLLPRAERVYWYSLLDLPAGWEMAVRGRAAEGCNYYRHFRMGVYDVRGNPKPAAERLRDWIPADLGLCEWLYWREDGGRFHRMVRLLRELGVRRLRTGIGWADWDRPMAVYWFDRIMAELSDFDVVLTLCFTPARLGVAPQHYSPPVDLTTFADFCEAVVRRYVLRGEERPASARV